MESTKRFVGLGLCMLVVLALAAEADAQCSSLSTLAPCFGAVEGPYPPRPTGQCCNVVRMANPSCLCRQFLSGNYPQNLVRNAFAMPRACGRFDLRGYRCGRYTIE